MGTLLIIAAVLVGIIVLLFVVALFSRKGYKIERSVLIAKPIGHVFDYLKNIKNQDYFNKWVMTDPNMKKSFKGTDGTKGFIYGWDGNSRAGAGEQEIKSIDNNRRIDLEIRFVRPFKGIANSTIETEPLTGTANNSTIVKWSFSSEMKYPMNIFLLVTNIEKKLEKDLDLSLTNLRTILEK